MRKEGRSTSERSGSACCATQVVQAAEENDFKGSKGLLHAIVLICGGCSKVDLTPANVRDGTLDARSFAKLRLSDGRDISLIQATFPDFVSCCRCCRSALYRALSQPVGRPLFVSCCAHVLKARHHTELSRLADSCIQWVHHEIGFDVMYSYKMTELSL